MSIPSFATRRPVAVWMLFLAIALLGGVSYARLPIDLLPDVSYPRLLVHTPYPEVAPSEVERQITERVESAVAGVPGVQRVTSVSREGVSLVTLGFAWGTDMDFAMLAVREALDDARQTLPRGAGRPTILRLDPDSDPVMTLSVAGSGDLWQIKELAETVIRRRLEELDGVAQASVTGGLDREIQVEVNPVRLESYGLTPADVSRALAEANVSAPGGTILQGRYRYPLRTLGELQSVDEMRRVIVAERDSAGAARVIRLGNVAHVVDGYAERQAVARYGGHEAVGILVFKEAGANTVAVAEDVEEVLAELAAEYPTVQIDVASSQAIFIAESISNVVQALGLGGILAFLVLFLFLRDARYPVVIALSIPISVVGTFALMDAAGVSLNIMSLGGLALGVGMLVDNSIVVLENVFRHREEAGADAAGAAARGAREVQGAITASTLTTVAVFGPIVYVEGVAGELFEDLSLAVTFSLLASLAVALTLVPSLAARFGAEGVGRPRARFFVPLGSAFDRAFARFASAYHALLARALDRPGRVLGASAAALAAAALVAYALPRDLLPDVEQGAFTVRLELEEGTTLEATLAAAAEVEAAALADPDVAAVFTNVGRDPRAYALGEEATGLHTATLQVRLRPGARTTPSAERIRALAARVPAKALTVETGRATALGAMLGGSEADVAVRVRSEDLDLAHAAAEELERRLSTLERLGNVRVATVRGQPELRIEIDRAAATRFGIDARAVAETIERAVRGEVATQYVDFDRKIDVVVRYPSELRYARQTLEELRVQGVPLRELVHVAEALGPVEVRREDQTRVVPVYADVVRGGLGAAITEVEAALAAFDPGRGVRVDVGGENEEMLRSFRDLAFAFALALVLVYMILAAQFESFAHPFTILVSVPLALIGAVAALALTGQGWNTMSLIGLVILVGIVVNDAIVKVDFIDQARASGLPLRTAILEAGRLRLRPILMTTATTVLGLFPMALGIGLGADLRAPLAIAVIGGVVAATALTLVVVPVAYETVERVRTKLGGSRASGS